MSGMSAGNLDGLIMNLAQSFNRVVTGQFSMFYIGRSMSCNPERASQNRT